MLGALSNHGHPVTLFTRHIHPPSANILVRSLNRVDFVEALRSAPAVVSSAGSQLMSECVFLGISQFALYDADDDEQRLNVEMLRDAGLGDGCTFGSFTPERLHRFLNQLNAGGRTPPPLPTPNVATAVLRLVRQLA